MSSSKKTVKDVTHSIFMKIQREEDERDIIDAINKHAENIDFDKTFGLFEDSLLTAALNNSLGKVVACILKFEKRANLGHVNKSGQTALLLACKHNFRNFALKILEYEKKCVPDEDGYTALMYTCGNEGMIDVTEHMIKHDVCDIGHVNESGDTALSLTLEVGNPRALTLLLDSGKSNPGMKDPKNPTVTLFEKTLSEEDVESAKMILEKTGMDCDPLNGTNEFGSTALMLAIPRHGGDDEPDYIDIIRMLLDFASKTKNKEYVNTRGGSGYCAFDLIFEYAAQNDEPINPHLIKLFLDYYYKNDQNSPAFLQNIDEICQDTVLYKAIKRVYPTKALKKIIKNACRNFHVAPASLVNPPSKSKSPEIYMGKRESAKRSTRKVLQEAEEIPIIHATSPVSPPIDSGFFVGDPRDRGIRQRKTRRRRGGILHKKK